VSFSLSTGGGEDEELLYEVRFVDWLGERVLVLVLDEVSVEPGLLRNTCSSGIRDKDMKASSPYIFFSRGKEVEKGAKVLVRPSVRASCTGCDE
jgi:hypothetical protein